ncbi:tigger transposable element-derived protein 1 [Nephila pilipes]|uniref:Tigger transposable element-derived protein 1 n=1 Tax=Nephila pilipes TaxID=299642 RepID=A0A8X6PMX0_NEPPI|nr:tigger transposable element-derived protein 1 [Nephila pilipes]
MDATTCYSLYLCLFFVSFWIVYILYSAYFVILNIDPKVKDKTGEKKKPKKMISMEAKHEIIANHERGVRIIDLANEYGHNHSTISTIIKQKKAIKMLQHFKGVTIISKLRTNMHDEMEQLLLSRIKGKQLASDSVSEAIICEKAGAIFQVLKRDVTETERESSQDGEEFKASCGCFDNFKKRSGIHSVIRHGEASSGDIMAAENFIKVFEKLISEEGYLPQKMFNCDETGLFCKKMPRRTFITAEEKNLPGHKAMKDRLTLALCSNAIGDFKIKPLLVYHSENPRAFKAYKVMKEKLEVLWRAKNIAWQGVTKRTLNSAWRKLWPDVVLKREGFEGFEPIEEEIVSIGRSMGLEVEEADVADLIEEYAEELTTEGLKELQKISHSGVMMELSSEKEVEPKEKLTSREISDILGKWQEVSDFVEKRHLEKLSTGRASALFDDRCLTLFRNILKRRQKHTSLDRYLVKVSRSESQESEAKKARR